MAITGVTSNYSSYYAQSKSVEEEIKKSTDKVNQTSSNSNSTKQTSTTAAEYTKYLQGKFSYCNKSASMEGVPTTVSVSGAFIKKCANDPEKAKYLEENLNAIPKSVAHSVAVCPGTLTNISFWIDADGNISSAMSGTSDPDGKIARENAERKAKESKEKAEKAEEKRAAKRAEEKKAEEKRRQEAISDSSGEIVAQQSEFSMTVTGSSVGDITEKISSVASGVTLGGVSGTFDMRA